MSQELVYTSVPRGLAPGSHGFCTVACTRGMSANLMRQLESLSGYRQLFATQDASAAMNPVAFSHLMLTVGGRRCHVLSRVCDAGADYSQRSNKFAHHVVLDAAELPPGGPAWLLGRQGFMRSGWDAEPSLLPAGPAVPSADAPPAVCRAWQKLVGDAGWAGVLAETAAKTPGQQATMIFRPGTDALSLLAEALALLPKERRWGVSLNTYFTKLPPGVVCQWRCLADGTPEAAAARRSPPAGLLLDLCRPLGRAAEGPYVQAARTGRMPAAVAPSATSDAELIAALQDGEPSAAQSGVDLSSLPPQERRREAAYGLEADPTSANYPPPLVEPPPYSPRRFKPKPRRRWPWIAAIAASILILVGGGIAVGWLAATWNRPVDGRGEVAVAPPKEEAKNQSTVRETKQSDVPAPPQNAAFTYEPQQPATSSAAPAGGQPAKPQNPPAVAGKQPEIKQPAAARGEKSVEKTPAPAISKGLPAPRAPSASSEPPQAPDQQKLAAWLSALPAAVTLPELSGGAGFERTGGPARTIAEGDWCLPRECSLTLLGGRNAFGEGTTCVLRRDKKSPSRWTFVAQYKEGVAPETRECTVAHIGLKQDGLSFRWELDVSRNVKLTLLRNCVLRIGTAEDVRHVALRKEEEEDGKAGPYLRLLKKEMCDPRSRQEAPLLNWSRPITVSDMPIDAELSVELLGLKLGPASAGRVCWLPNQDKEQQGSLSVTYPTDQISFDKRLASGLNDYRMFIVLHAKVKKSENLVYIKAEILRPKWLRPNLLEDASEQPGSKKLSRSDSGPTYMLVRDGWQNMLARKIAAIDRIKNKDERSAREEELNILRHHLDNVKAFLSLLETSFGANSDIEPCYCIYMTVEGHRVDLLRRDPRQTPQQK
ncbi:MAG: hypothetical protein ABFC96_07890 [Thermoguttaceae bacterium]